MIDLLAALSDEDAAGRDFGRRIELEESIDETKIDVSGVGSNITEMEDELKVSANQDELEEPEDTVIEEDSKTDIIDTAEVETKLEQSEDEQIENQTSPHPIPQTNNESPQLRKRFKEKTNRNTKEITSENIFSEHGAAEKLLALLTDEDKLEGFKSSLSEGEVTIISLWKEIERFFGLSQSSDSVVTNNMARKICVDHYACEHVPPEIRKELNPTEITNIEDRSAFMKGVMNHLFDYILTELLPKYVDSGKRRRRAKTQLTKSVQRDPFEDTDPKLVRFVFSPNGERVLVACTCEKMIHLLTSDNKGRVF